jgi:iron complex transport system substrate-binding protein
MRIVSLLPSATEIVCALGLRDQLVGRTHRCDYPPDVKDVAVVTAPTDGAHDAADELGPARLIRETLAGVAPELILVREARTGLGSRQIEAALIDVETSPRVMSLDPVSLEGILNTVSTIGAMTESEDDAMGLVEAMREDLGEVEQQVVVRHDQGLRPRRVVVLEGLDPLMASGRWVPEQVRRAGGWDVLGREGEAPAPTTWEAILDVDPDMLVIAPAGLTLIESQKIFRRLVLPEAWAAIDAVRRGHVFFVEPIYFSRPGPRVVEGVAMLAEIFDPDAFVDASPPNSWTVLSDGGYRRG